MENSELLQHIQGIPVPPLLCDFAFGKAVNGYPGYNYIFACGWNAHYFSFCSLRVVHRITTLSASALYRLLRHYDQGNPQMSNLELLITVSTTAEVRRGGISEDEIVGEDLVCQSNISSGKEFLKGMTSQIFIFFKQQIFALNSLLMSPTWENEMYHFIDLA